MNPEAFAVVIPLALLMALLFFSGKAIGFRRGMREGRVAEANDREVEKARAANIEAMNSAYRLPLNVTDRELRIEIPTGFYLRGEYRALIFIDGVLTRWE